MSVDAKKVYGKKKWTKDEIAGLQQAAKRIHFDHFRGVPSIDGIEWHEWMDGNLHRFKEQKPKETRKTRTGGRDG